MPQVADLSDLSQAIFSNRSGLKKETTLKKQNEQGAGVERILGRKLARELRGAELARINGAYADPGNGIQPISTTTLIQPPDTRNDGYVA